MEASFESAEGDMWNYKHCKQQNDKPGEYISISRFFLPLILSSVLHSSGLFCFLHQLSSLSGLTSSILLCFFSLIFAPFSLKFICSHLSPLPPFYFSLPPSLFLFIFPPLSLSFVFLDLSFLAGFKCDDFFLSSQCLTLLFSPCFIW